MAGLPRRLANSEYYLRVDPTPRRAPMIKDLTPKKRKGWFVDEFGHRYIPWTEEERKLWPYQEYLRGYDTKTHDVLWVVPDKKAIDKKQLPGKGAVIGPPKNKDDTSKTVMYEAQTPFMYATPYATARGKRRTAYIVIKRTTTESVA